MKKTLSLLITLAMFAATAVIPVSATAETIGSAKWDGTTLDNEWSGTGAENDPYLITSANSWWNCSGVSGTDYSDKYTINTTYTNDAEVVAAQLVDGGDVWVLDNADTPVNGGYPVLAWEKYWTSETAPTSFYKAVGVNVSDGKVTGANVIVSNGALQANVIVAVYSADGRFIDVSETSTVTNGVADVEDLTVESGSKVNVLVWNANQTPMCDCYETVVE